jgi:hypothetical protein
VKKSRILQVAEQVFFLPIAEPSAADPNLRKKAVLAPNRSGQAVSVAPTVTALQLKNRWLLSNKSSKLQAGSFSSSFNTNPKRQRGPTSLTLRVGIPDTNPKRERGATSLTLRVSVGGWHTAS